MQILEQYSIGKSTTIASEDAIVVTSSYAAVIDGATPKTKFRYPSGETPGQLAARLLVEAIKDLPSGITAFEAVPLLTKALHQEEVTPENRPIASAVIFSALKREVWLIGDCLFGEKMDDQFTIVTNRKHIDEVLASWRRDVIISYLSRGIMTEREIQANDPGRKIIQPIITRQVRYQNQPASTSRFAYTMLDGMPIADDQILVYPIEDSASELILASDGYPILLPTLAESEEKLAQLLHEDPLCIGPLLGTKGIRPGNRSYDDRSFLRIKL